MGKKLQNNSNSNYVNTINYILDVIAAGIKKYGIMGYKLETIDIILLFEQESKLKFESRSKNENVECGHFSLELLLLIIIKHLIVMRNHQLSFVLRSIPFNFNEIHIKLLTSNIVLSVHLIFIDDTENNSSDGEKIHDITKRTHITAKAAFGIEFSCKQQANMLHFVLILHLFECIC